MDRLTIALEEVNWLGSRYGFACENDDLRNVNIGAVLERLGKYEDIGLTPEQLTEIDKLYTEKCQEVAELRKQQAESAYKKTMFTNGEGEE